jgi:5-carboxymethyl-2-hydroxymuconate isomerase
MPHFILDCSESILKIQTEEQILKEVFLVAASTGLFSEDDIKVRVHPFKTYSAGNKREDFVHVFAYIMEGRSTAQKADLSRKIVEKLTVLFPTVSRIAMNVIDFEKATYFNRDMLS